MDVAKRAVSFDDVLAASMRLRKVAHRTPVMRSRTLDALTGAQVFLKCENLQRVGAFKFRGAYNRISQLTPQEKGAGVVAFSSGNHAQGVAHAAELLGVPATIVMPSDAPRGKLAATRGYGATVVTYDRDRDDRDAIASQLAREHGSTLIPPFDDAEIIAGQGTAMLELLEESGPFDMALVPLGGGGLLAGSCLSVGALSPQTSIYGVEPEAGDDWVQSLEAGERRAISPPQTLADGAQSTMPGRLNFPIVRDIARGVVTASDDELCSAMAFAFSRLKLVIEPTGALALAALIHRRIDAQGARVGVMVSGGNVDADVFAKCLARAASRESC